MRTVNPTKPGSRLGMPVSAWPAVDQITWAAAFAPPELLDDRPNGSDLRLPTRVAHETCYARWLVFLRDSDPEALDLPPEARATRDRIRAYVNMLLEELAVLTVYSYVARLKRALQLLCPDADRSWMNPMLRKLNKRGTAGGAYQGAADRVTEEPVRLRHQADQAGRGHSATGRRAGGRCARR